MRDRTRSRVLLLLRGELVPLSAASREPRPSSRGPVQTAKQLIGGWRVPEEPVCVCTSCSKKGWHADGTMPKVPEGASARCERTVHHRQGGVAVGAHTEKGSGWASQGLSQGLGGKMVCAVCSDSQQGSRRRRSNRYLVLLALSPSRPAALLFPPGEN